MNQITDRLKDTIKHATELLQMLINIQPSDQNESNSISDKVIHLISLLATISIESNKVQNVYNNHHSKLSNCLVDMKTLVQSQKRKISILERKPYCTHKATNTDSSMELPSVKEIPNIGNLNLEHNVNNEGIENITKTVRRLENQVEEQTFTINSLRKKLHQSCSLLKAQQVLIDNCSYSDSSILYPNSTNSYNNKKYEAPSLIYSEESIPQRPPLVPDLSCTTSRIRSSKPMEFNTSHDLDFVDSTNINYHDDDDEIFEAECALKEYSIIEANLSNTSKYVLDSIKYDNDNIKEKDISLNIDNYSETNSNYLDDNVFKDLSDSSQNGLDVNCINVNKYFESDNLSYSHKLISITNTTINEDLGATDKVDITNGSSNWNINNVNDSFALVQDFYDSRFSE